MYSWFFMRSVTTAISMGSPAARPVPLAWSKTTHVSNNSFTLYSAIYSLSGQRVHLTFYKILNVIGRKEMFYLMTHSTHFIYGYMTSDIWLRTMLIVRKETRCHNIGYSFRSTARVLLYAPSHRQDSTYHGLCYTSR